MRAFISIAMLCALPVLCGGCPAPQARDAAPAEATKVAEPAEAAESATKATAPAAPATPAATAKGTTVYDLTIKTMDGKSKALSDYKGKAVLIVNTASKCGLTPQYKGLQALYTEFAPQGLEILGVPSNDFGGQEPGTHEEIQAFCSGTYEVTFPLFAKSKVTGDDKTPLYRRLTEEGPEAFRGAIMWNFTKFLIDTEGTIVARFGPREVPESEDIRAAILKALPKK